MNHAVSTGTDALTTDTTTATQDATGGLTRIAPGGIERRACRRTRVHGDAMIAFRSTAGEEHTRKVEFLDASVSGIGIRSEKPVRIGTEFALFPDKVRQSSWTGSVVRCVQDGDGWTIGLQLAEAA
ncbi:MAG TPA: PilZ domain-containing protein [Phycisphaerales bacterium]|nr:PilZ domain-containing protein [Phycisphaerales bacterium]